MIHDFNTGTEGWTDWNILLDEEGGPNHVGNFCFAPIHADTRTGALIYTNSYYYIGHFSRFIRPGAKRVLAAPSRSTLLSTAFVNEDGTVAVVVGAGVILFDPIFQGLAISLMAGEIASLLISRMAVPVLYYMAYSKAG